MAQAWVRAREDGRAKREEIIGVYVCIGAAEFLILIVMEEVQGYWHGIFWYSVEMCENIEIAL